jgi:hypothetical protein
MLVSHYRIGVQARRLDRNYGVSSSQTRLERSRGRSGRFGAAPGVDLGKRAANKARLMNDNSYRTEGIARPKACLSNWTDADERSRVCRGSRSVAAVHVRAWVGSERWERMRRSSRQRRTPNSRIAVAEGRPDWTSRPYPVYPMRLSIWMRCPRRATRCVMGIDITGMLLRHWAAAVVS